MPKRLVRLDPNDKREAIYTYLNREISLVMMNGNTFFGTLLTLTDQELTLLDKRNHNHVFLYSEVQELVVDTAAPW